MSEYVDEQVKQRAGDSFEDNTLMEQYAAKQAELNNTVSDLQSAQQSILNDREQAEQRLNRVRQLLGVAQRKGVIHQEMASVIHSVLSEQDVPDLETAEEVIMSLAESINKSETLITETPSTDHSEYIPEYSSRSTSSSGSLSSREIAENSTRMKVKTKQMPASFSPGEVLAKIDQVELVDMVSTIVVDKLVEKWGQEGSDMQTKWLATISKPSKIKKFFEDVKTRDQFSATMQVLAKQEMGTIVDKCKSLQQEASKMELAYNNVLRELQSAKNATRADMDVLQTKAAKSSWTKYFQCELLKTLALPSPSVMADLVAMLKLYVFEGEPVTSRVEAKNVLVRVIAKAPAKWALPDLRKEVKSLFNRHFRQVATSYWAQSDTFTTNPRMPLAWSNVICGDVESDNSSIGVPRAQSSALEAGSQAQASNMVDNDASSTSSSDSDSDETSSSDSDSTQSSQEAEPMRTEPVFRSPGKRSRPTELMQQDLSTHVPTFSNTAELMNKILKKSKQ